MSPANPAEKIYAALHRAFDFFNDLLFGGELPPCLVTLQRKNKSLWLFRRQPVRIEGRHGDHRRNRVVSVTLQKPHRRAKPFHPRP
ncbi:hypothetical protein [Mesorhizobium sp. LSJC285A00]|uniref:hypothetical protein n=1 Tax=Mesorhizobium sp. LSJC285A00 TaxID=1287338 RepID=UPI0018DCCBFF|nr:hypothetical protein [Mesorhizobium sp. LSJC285A00]